MDNRKLVVALIITLITVTISSVVYIHERDVDSIVENAKHIEQNQLKISELAEYKAGDEVEKVNLSKSIQTLANAVTQLNESVIRLEEQGK